MNHELSVNDRSLLVYLQHAISQPLGTPTTLNPVLGLDLQSTPIHIPSPSEALEGILGGAWTKVKGAAREVAWEIIEGLPEAPAPKAEKPMSVREEKKQQTRQALLDAALKLASEGAGFAALSLREVTREAGLVPTAFYRHFREMDELGLALVDDACLTLRRLIRDARVGAMGAGGLAIRTSIQTYLSYVRQHAPAFEFLVRERSGGSAVVREAIAREIRFFISELATDLRFVPHFKDFPAEDLEMIADLVVNTIASLAQDILALPEGQTRLEQDIESRAVKQLRLIFLGAGQWKPKTA